MLTTYFDAFTYLAQEAIRLADQEAHISVQDVTGRATAGTLFLWLNKHHGLVLDALGDTCMRSMCIFLTDAIPDAKMNNGALALAYAAIEGADIFRDKSAGTALY